MFTNIGSYFCIERWIEPGDIAGPIFAAGRSFGIRKVAFEAAFAESLLVVRFVSIELLFVR